MAGTSVQEVAAASRAVEPGSVLVCRAQRLAGMLHKVGGSRVKRPSMLQAQRRSLLLVTQRKGDSIAALVRMLVLMLTTPCQHTCCCLCCCRCCRLHSPSHSCTSLRQRLRLTCWQM